MRRDDGAVGLVEHEGRAVQQRVVQHVAPHGDGGAVEHRVHVDGAVIAHVLAIGPFRLDIAALVEIALERHLGVGRHQDVVGEAFDDGAGSPRKVATSDSSSPGWRIVAATKSSGCAPTVKVIGQLLAARDAGGVDALQIGRRGDVGAGLVAVAQAEAAAADIASPGRGIDHVVDGRAHIAAAVIGVLRMEGQLGEIDVLAGDLDLVHRRVVRGHLDQRLRIGEPLEIFVVELVLGWSRTRRRGACGCRRSWPPARPVPARPS